MKRRLHLLTAVVLVGLVYAGLWGSTQVQDQLRYDRTNAEVTHP